MNVSPLNTVDAYRQLATIRAFEEQCQQLSMDDQIAGSVHLCLGQEAIPTGALAALTEVDRVISTYRGHGWAIACGVPLVELMAEICQRSDGINGGRGGSAYLSAPRYRFLGENSIVGAGVPIGAGAALATQRRGDGGVVVVSVGDGAINQGALGEGMAFAAAQALPLVVVCENNGWSEMTDTSTQLRASLTERMAGYGVRAEVVDGCDAEAVRTAVVAAAEHARSGAGPVFLDCQTVRLSGHYNRDIEHYRPAEDKERATREEPLARLRERLIDDGSATATQLDAVAEETAAEVRRIAEKVLRMPPPEPATAGTGVFAAASTTSAASATSTTSATSEVSGTPKELTYQMAVNHALRAELEQRDEVLLLGEDIGAPGGIFGVTRRLQRDFGPERVIDTPIAESAILGASVGAAVRGMRPVAEIMWADFLLVALDQLINQAANLRYVTNGELQVPLVVRTQQGVTPGSCAQHSQSLEALLAHIPGLKVGLPATPHDAYAMLRAAVADADPCVVLESRAMYQETGPVWMDAEPEPAHGARQRRDGADLTILTWGTMVAPSLAAANELAGHGVEAAVLDLRWLRPLDRDSIARVVGAGAGRVLVVHEANLTGGFGAEVAATVQAEYFDHLVAPVVRLGTPDARIPSAPSLQRALVPDAAAIMEQGMALVQRQARHRVT